MKLGGKDCSREEVRHYIDLIVEDAREMLKELGQALTDERIIKMLAATVLYLRTKNAKLELEQ